MYSFITNNRQTIGIYKKLNSKYLNPFIGSYIQDDYQYLNLCKYYDEFLKDISFNTPKLPVENKGHPTMFLKYKNMEVEVSWIYETNADECLSKFNKRLNRCDKKLFIWGDSLLHQYHDYITRRRLATEFLRIPNSLYLYSGYSDVWKDRDQHDRKGYEGGGHATPTNWIEADNINTYVIDYINNTNLFSVIIFVDNTNYSFFNEVALPLYNKLINRNNLDKFIVISTLPFIFESTNRRSEIPIIIEDNIINCFKYINSNIFVVASGSDYINTQLDYNSLVCGDKLQMCCEDLNNNLYKWAQVSAIIGINKLFSNAQYMNICPQVCLKDVCKLLNGTINNLELFIRVYWLIILNNNLYSQYISTNTFYNINLDTNIYEPLPTKYENHICQKSTLDHTLFHTINTNSEDIQNIIYDSFNYNSNEIKEILDQLIIKTTNHTFVRIGNNNDGGYVCLKYFDIDKIYGLGVGNNYNFESELMNCSKAKNCYLYDPTVDLNNLPNNYTFYKVGIDYYNHLNFNTLETMIRTNGDWGNNKLFLKIDVEGYEYMSLLTSSSEVLNHFTVIVMEIHYLHTWKNASYKYKRDMLIHLNKHFDLVHVHGNNCAPTINLPHSIRVHPVLELTFIRKDLNVNSTIKQNVKLPIELDSPNDRNKEEIIMSDFYPFNNRG